MTAGGWLFLALSWGSIILLVVYCMAKVLKKRSDHED